jgi:hypothetical protein
MTSPAAVPEQVHVELELLALRCEVERAIVKLVERRALAEQAQPSAHAGDVRVDRHVALAVGEQQHARGGLAADAGQRDQLGTALLDGQAGEALVEVLDVDLAQDVLDPGGLDLRDAARADRELDVGVGRVADRLPAAEAVAQGQERDIAVAVVGRLRQDGEDQLVEAVPVRRRERPAVDLTQPVADATDAGAGPAVEARYPVRGKSNFLRYDFLPGRRGSGDVRRAR